jgi:hypothetical protein
MNELQELAESEVETGLVVASLTVSAVTGIVAGKELANHGFNKTLAVLAGIGTTALGIKLTGQVVAHYFGEEHEDYPPHRTLDI